MASASILNTGKAMYAWNGTNWLPLNAQNSLINSTRWQKIATGGETTLSGYDDNGLNLSYSPGYEQIFLNGILLVRNSDYTASNGTTITGLAAITAGSIIEIISLKSLSIANVYTQEQSDARYATQTDLDNIDLSSASAAAVAYLVDGAPAALNTLNELAAALDDNADILDLYLTQTSASSTYLTQSNASATYLTESSASSNYLKKIEAQSLYVPASDSNSVYNKMVSFQHYNTGYGASARTTTTANSWYTINIGGTNLTGTRASGNNNIITFNKQYTNSHLLINIFFPIYITPGDSGVGIRCQLSVDGTNYSLVDIIDSGPANGWGAAGYGGNTSTIVNYSWSTKDKTSIANSVLNKTGEVRLYFQGFNWTTADTAFWIDYDPTYPKFGSINIFEIKE
jgi:hypothetical protein